MKITIKANKKIINYLDIALNLNTEKHEPYIKPENAPKHPYINTNSNHPPAVIKTILEGVNKKSIEPSQ